MVRRRTLVEGGPEVDYGHLEELFVLLRVTPRFIVLFQPEIPEQMAGEDDVEVGGSIVGGGNTGHESRTLGPQSAKKPFSFL